MATFTQDHRPLQVTTPLPANTLLIEKLTGTEAISTLFEFHLDLLAEKPIAFEKIVGQNVTASLQVAGGGTRFFSGIVRRFQQGNRVPGPLGSNTFIRYRAEVVPQLWLLSRTCQSRIFTNQSVPDILKTVLTGLKVTYELTGSYDPRNYCVQYRESDFAFASRLMEEEGIFYFFKHDKSGHTLVVADANLSFPKAEPDAAIYERIENLVASDARVTSWEKNQEVCPGKYTLWDHSFELPGQHLEASATLQESATAGTVSHPFLSGVNSKLEIYDYPGGYAKRFDGISPTGGAQPDQTSKIFVVNQSAVKLRMEQEAVQGLQISGEGTYGGFTAGYQFQLSRHFDADGSYGVTRVEHQVSVEGGLTSTAEVSLAYSNRFECIPIGVPYRPRRVTPQPRIDGTQTATVVSVDGDDPSCDKYARVKVLFPWERAGSSSCWLRVGQPWAGQTWGAHHVPRAGQEVIVAFHEGDPDRPVVVGSVYNAAQMPPYPLPGQKMQSGLVSSSGGAENFHEIRLDDTSGKELMLLHSERDLVHESENDHGISVGNNQTFQVAKNHQLKAGNAIFMRVGGGSGSGGGSEDAGSDSNSGSGGGSETVFSDSTIADNHITLQTPNMLTIAEISNNLLVGGMYITMVGGFMNTTVVGMNSAFNFGLVFNINAAYTMVLQVGKTKVNMGPLTDVNAVAPEYALKTDVTKVEADVTNLNATVTNTVATKSELVAEINKVEGTVTRETATINETIATHTREIAAVNETIATHTKEIATVNEVVGEQTEEIASVNKTIASQTETIANLDRAIATTNEVLGDVAQVAATIEQSVAEITQVTMIIVL